MKNIVKLYSKFLILFLYFVSFLLRNTRKEQKLQALQQKRPILTKRYEVLFMYYTYATCALRDRYARHELFTSRHVASINHSIYCRNSCSETAVPFHLTNVYALCQRLLTLIILINCSPLIKTSQFPVCKLYSNTRIFARLEQLSSKI